MTIICPWPITRVEPRGGTWVRVVHADGTSADHDFSYLLDGRGVFAELTAEMIPGAGIADGGTVGWVMPDGSVVDIAPDAVWEHAVLGRCPGGSCAGWSPEMTRLVERGEEP